MSGMLGKIAVTFRRVYRPRYIALNAAAAVAYYLIFVYLIRSQNYGILITTIPLPMVYALAITSSIMLTLGIYSIRNSRKRSGVSAGAAGTFMALFAGIIGGCGCASPLIFYGVAAIGLNIVEATVFEAFLINHAIEIITLMLAVNVLLILYYSLKLSDSNKRGRARHT